MTTDKLSATDRAFLAIEEGALRMHVAAVMVFDGGDFIADDGALDAGRLTALLAAGGARVPRLRQRVRGVPRLGAGGVLLLKPCPQNDSSKKTRSLCVSTAIFMNCSFA